MTERLLQFIWQLRYFDKNELVTSAGEPLQIIFPGNLNNDQGPDFSEAKIRIAETTWIGSIELHIKASDWKKHKHHNDENYNNVILHVVWQNDINADNLIPVLELQGRVSKILLERYETLMTTIAFIPCERAIHSVRDIIWKSWKERLLAERLSRKAMVVEDYLKDSNCHWEETFWRLLARNFGMKVNADAFEEMARSISLNILAKHKNQINQLEALLLGQCNLLKANFKDDYSQMLQKEYVFLKKKYELRPIHTALFFLRMRPGNFPTIRLAQLATLVQQSVHLFSRIKEAGSVDQVRQWLAVSANDYWHYHYRLDELSQYKMKRVGTQMINNIIINTIVPSLFTYGNYHSEERYKQKALRWLEQTAAENNSITNSFEQLNVENKTAFDSQALVELQHGYCNKKRCLDCAIGNAILKN